MRPEQVTELFQRLNKQLKIGRNAKNWFGQCLNPKHPDKNPSMLIGTQHPHPFKCYSCGFTGTLVNIAKNMGLEIENKISFQDHKKMSLPDLSKINLQPWTEFYRGLTPEHWQYFGAMKWLDYTLDHDTNEWVLTAERLWLPVRMNGTLVGYTGRRVDDSDFMRYKNFEGMLATEALFPYDMWQPTYPVVLTEGPLDAIKFVLYQIPALAIFGVENWSVYKLKMVLQKNPSTIWICMDGDERGQEAQAKLYNKIKNYGDVQCVQLPSGVDPFELDHNLLMQIQSELWARHYQKTGQQVQEPV